MQETVETFRFTPDMLAPAKRLPGISAFMRIRNGADFLEATIRSHAALYDEIVAVHNQCNDATADILARLSAEMGPRLRVFHYLPQVNPAGSDGHARTPGDAPHSLVTYSNFALCQTRHEWAVKLDDDHLAIPQAVGEMVGKIRAGAADPQVMHCFSGLNLVRGPLGAWHVPAAAPVSGKGDIGYFRVGEGTHFAHDPRFERFVRGNIVRRFAGWFYWHLKFLKSGGGFANYELGANPGSRYVRRQARLQAGALWSLPETINGLKPGPLRRLRAVFDAKERLAVTRDNALGTAFAQSDLEAALDASAPGWRHWLEVGQ
ncbi:glycosyltransferase family 2 protein [Pseudorhodobacter ferrugineus]|uniref:glycosyltransferase family 2 protein n=1 Tax=Pseudorhodobacter ferrugineus TaxID=77008 RepID=UPI0003B58D09|nr:glycosyltransferase family 2 protein [Pseudorhodobacter ferrugineus]